MMENLFYGFMLSSLGLFIVPSNLLKISLIRLCNEKEKNELNPVKRKENQIKWKIFFEHINFPPLYYDQRFSRKERKPRRMFGIESILPKENARKHMRFSKRRC